jgi:hypothetical protein
MKSALITFQEKILKQLNPAKFKTRWIVFKSGKQYASYKMEMRPQCSPIKKMKKIIACQDFFPGFFILASFFPEFFFPGNLFS